MTSKINIVHCIVVAISLVLSLVFNYFFHTLRTRPNIYFDIFIPYGCLSLIISFSFWYTLILASLFSKITAYLIFPLLFLHSYIWYYISTRYGAEMSETIVGILNTTFEEATPFFRINTACLFVIFSILPFIIIFSLRRYPPPQVTVNIITSSFFLLFTFFSTLILRNFHPSLAIKLYSFQTTIDDYSWQAVNLSKKDFLLRSLAEKYSNNIFFHAYHPFFREISAAQIIWDNYHPTQLIDSRKITSFYRWNDENLTVILYIGESFRAANNPMNGYHRNTLPLLSKINNIINLPSLHSNATSTIPAIYDILVGKDSLDRRPKYSSFIDIFSKHLFHTELIVSQNTEGMWYNTPSIHPLLVSCRDTLQRPQNGWELAEEVKRRIRRGGRNFLLIEDGTGHMPYRSSSELWKGESIDQYDNAILDIDRNLDSLIRAIEKENAIILYTSDHGESFGEDHYWGHGGPTSNREQTHVSGFVWFSDEYNKRHQEVINRLRENASSFNNHDMIYHTILSLGGIQSELQSTKLDMTQIRSSTKSKSTSVQPKITKPEY